MGIGHTGHLLNSSPHKAASFNFLYSLLVPTLFSFYKCLLRTYYELIILLLVMQTEINNILCSQDMGSLMRDGEAWVRNDMKQEKSVMGITAVKKELLRKL